MRRLTACLLAALATTILALPAVAIPVGTAAPDFSLTDVKGQSVKLSDYKGKYVVLEWVNPGCPFVQKHYNSGNMPRLQKDATAQGVVWLTVDSTKPSSQDFQSAPQLASWLQAKGAVPSAVMLDQEGKVGKLYTAKTTPHMFVIDPQGKLIYAGAIDSIRSTDVDDIQKATNYVKVALAEAQAGKPVSTASTQAYGCTIKY
jgi:peroxiredoxin